MTRVGALAALALAAGALLWGDPAGAHHSVTAMYDLTRVVTLTGTVQSLTLGSPHSRLIVQVPQPHGPAGTWQIELPSFAFLDRAGWTDRTLTHGEKIALTASPGRYDASLLYARSITRADGTRLALVPGATPPR